MSDVIILLLLIQLCQYALMCIFVHPSALDITSRPRESVLLLETLKSQSGTYINLIPRL